MFIRDTAHNYLSIKLYDPEHSIFLQPGSEVLFYDTGYLRGVLEDRFIPGKRFHPLAALPPLKSFIILVERFEDQLSFCLPMGL
jgi:hypothetical protein